MADEVFSVLAGISPILDDKALYKQLKMRLDLGNFAASIGSIDAQFCGFFADEGDPHDQPTAKPEDHDDLEQLFLDTKSGDLDLDVNGSLEG